MPEVTCKCGEPATWAAEFCQECWELFCAGEWWSEVAWCQSAQAQYAAALAAGHPEQDGLKMAIADTIAEELILGGFSIFPPKGIGASGAGEHQAPAASGADVTPSAASDILVDRAPGSGA